MKAIFFATLLAVSPACASDVDTLLNEAARRHNIPPEIIRAVAHIESTKRCGLKDGPHRGIMQVSRATAKEVGYPWPFKNCFEEIEAGAVYLRKALDRGGEDCAGISLYNTGTYAKPRCTAYGRKVISAMKRGV